MRITHPYLNTKTTISKISALAAVTVVASTLMSAIMPSAMTSLIGKFRGFPFHPSPHRLIGRCSHCTGDQLSIGSNHLPTRGLQGNNCNICEFNEDTMSDYFGSGSSSTAGLLGKIIIATGVFAAGYAVADYRLSVPNAKLTKTDAGIYVSYMQCPPRQISQVRGAVVAGTLEQRLDDLLNEDPRRIRQYVRSMTTRD